MGVIDFVVQARRVRELGPRLSDEERRKRASDTAMKLMALMGLDGADED